jgi:hypothetical protein
MKPDVFTRRGKALHSLKAEFMRDAPTDEWVGLPGGVLEGLRIPDINVDGITITGCWFARPAGDGDDA